MPNNVGQATVNPTPVNTSATPNIVTGAGDVQSPNATSVSEPVARPIPGTEGNPNNNLTGNTVGTGVPLSGNINNFTDAKKTDNIGMVPPPNNEKPKKEKKPMNKTLFVVIIIVLIALVAFGVYYLLTLSSKVKLETKEVTVGVGEALSDNIDDYVTVTKGDKSSCKLSTKNVNSGEIGEYTYSVTCGDDVYTGKVIVKDMDAPKVSLNIVFKAVGDTVTVDDFVESCTDSSECKTTFVNEETVKNYLATAGGPYKVEISAVDNSDNSITYDGSLYVTEYPIALYYNCSGTEEQVSSYQATKTINDVLPMGRGTDLNWYYLNVSLREYIYVFTSKDEYEEVTKNKESSISFDGNTGFARYDDDNLTLTIVTDLAKETLNSEAAGAPINTYTDIYQLYTSKGYMCSTQPDYPAGTDEN